jgi:hypothetical protein
MGLIARIRPLSPRRSGMGFAMDLPRKSGEFSLDER